MRPEVGGTAAAIHASHRQSLDGDHVLSDLRDRFDEVLARLEAAAGWQTARLQRPVLILGTIDVLVEVIDRLGRAEPSDQDRIDLSSYRGLKAPWNDWTYLKARGRHFGEQFAPLSLQKDGQP